MSDGTRVQGVIMVNLYDLLSVKPSATVEQIQRALINAAQKRTLSLEQLEKIKVVLLNDSSRAQYDAKLFANYPDIKAQFDADRTAIENREALQAQKLAQAAKATPETQNNNFISGAKKMGFGLNKLVQGVLGNMSEVTLDELEQQFNRYLFDQEKITIGYKLVRDVIVFTDQRILFIDKQGASGKKQSFKSIYLMNIVDVEMETAGMGLDDSEISIYCLQNIYRKAHQAQMVKFKFEFPKSTDIVPLYTMLGSLAYQNRLEINQPE